ncbi:hypothetical protein [Proteus penneri]|uniref:hypothetical protein n=1 Tax=Proteus penneri TaxID=102862 RepID=UPI00288BBEF9|nr:hypothetical protein [Proteus penneri]
MGQEFEHLNIKIGTCALCDSDNIELQLSHIIPKFVYDWLKETSITPFIRDIKNVNIRHQDGDKQYLLCNVCEKKLAVYENELASYFFKKIANYRTQKKEIQITEKMRMAVLSILWRALLTSKDQENDRIDEDNNEYETFLINAKKQLNDNKCEYTLFFAPIYGEPPHYGLPVSMTYGLDRSIGAQDIRFFDNPHRFIALFKLPFVYFFILEGEWCASELKKSTEFNAELIKMNEINYIPDVLKDIIKMSHEQFLQSVKDMNEETKQVIMRSVSEKKGNTGSDKSLKRSGWD